MPGGLPCDLHRRQLAGPWWARLGSAFSGARAASTNTSTGAGAVTTTVVVTGGARGTRMGTSRGFSGAARQRRKAPGAKADGENPSGVPPAPSQRAKTLGLRAALTEARTATSMLGEVVAESEGR